MKTLSSLIDNANGNLKSEKGYPLIAGSFNDWKLTEMIPVD